MVPWYHWYLWYGNIDNTMVHVYQLVQCHTNGTSIAIHVYVLWYHGTIGTMVLEYVPVYVRTYL
jgi:hypothetical protein